MQDPDALRDLAERRSCALHRAVAELLPHRPDLLARARQRVDTWLEDAGSHPYATAWKELLSLELLDLCEALGSSGEPMVTLRQASPFAGALDSRTRWRILKTSELSGR